MLVDGCEAAREHLLLVLHDHAERDAHRRVGHGAAAIASARAGERAQQARVRSARGRGSLASSRAAEVVSTLGQRRVEAPRGGEEPLGRAPVAHPVEEHPELVEQDRLARVVLERGDEPAGGGREQRASRRAAVEHGLHEAAAGLVAVVHVAPAAGLGEGVAQRGGLVGGDRGDAVLERDALRVLAVDAAVVGRVRAAERGQRDVARGRRERSSGRIS